MTATPAPTSVKSPARLKARKIGLWFGLIGGGFSAAGAAGLDFGSNMDGIVSALFAGFVSFVVYGGLAFGIAWLVIGLWRAIRSARDSA